MTNSMLLQFWNNRSLSVFPVHVVLSVSVVPDTPGAHACSQRMRHICICVSFPSADDPTTQSQAPLGQRKLRGRISFAKLRQRPNTFRFEPCQGSCQCPTASKCCCGKHGKRAVGEVGLVAGRHLCELAVLCHFGYKVKDGTALFTSFRCVCVCFNLHSWTFFFRSINLSDSDTLLAIAQGPPQERWNAIQAFESRATAPQGTATLFQEHLMSHRVVLLCRGEASSRSSAFSLLAFLAHFEILEPRVVASAASAGASASRSQCQSLPLPSVAQNKGKKLRSMKINVFQSRRVSTPKFSLRTAGLTGSPSSCATPPRTSPSR